MSTRRRRTLTAALGILAAAATTLTAAPAAFAAADPAVPADCGVSTSAVGSDGRQYSYSYDAKVAKATGPFGRSIGFVPSTLQNRGAMGDVGWFKSNDYAIDKATSTLYDVETEGTLTNGTWVYDVKTPTPLGTGWAPIRQLAFGYPYMYGLTDTGGLKRYSYSSPSPRPTSAGVVATSGWSGVRNLTYDRTVQLTSTRKADVLLATNTGSDALVEYTVPHDTPTSITRTVLKTGGWGSFTSISTGWCSSHPNARVMLGIYGDGRAKVFYDVNGADGKGTDLYGGTVVVATGWTKKSYSQ